MMHSVSNSAAAVQAGNAATNTTNTTSGNGALSGDDFMLLLLAQLKHQNPLDPMDEKAMMAQITQLNSLQELQKISSAIEAASKSSRLTEAAVLIGKNVTFKNEDGETETGVVTGVSIVGNETMLYVGEKLVPQSSVIAVAEVPEVPEEEGE